MTTVAKSSMIVTLFTAMGLGLGFLSNVIIAKVFGAGKDMDVFLAATTLPFFIVNILSSALNFTFIPIFAEYRAKDPKEIWSVVSSFINLNVMITTILCVIGIVLAYPIMRILTPGFTEEKIARTADILRWLFPIIIFVVINELMASVYYSNQRFVVPSLNKIISPLITMIYVILFHNYLSTKSIALAMLTATIIQTVLLSFGFLRTNDFNYSFILDYRHSGVVKILKLILPLILGMLIYRAVPVVDRYFLSKLSEGSISHIGYALKLIGVISPIIISGISISIFPTMSKYAADKNWDALTEIMSKGIKMLYFLSIPFVFFLSLYGKPIVQLIFERGAFKSSDTIAVYYAFAIYLWSLPASVIGSIVSQGFYVLQKNKTIAVIGVLMAGLYVLLCLLLLKRFNYLAIPIAYAIYHNCAIATTSSVLKKLIGKNIWLSIIPLIFKTTIVAILVLFTIYPIFIFAQNNIFFCVSTCAMGFVLYFVISKIFLKLEEANSILKVVFHRF